MSTDSRPLVGIRAAAVALAMAPLLEVVEGALSPLRGTSTGADLHAIAAHQAVFATSVLAGLLGTILYLPGLIGLAAATAGRSPVLARVGGSLAVLGFLAFASTRMVQAVQLQALRDGMPVGAAARLVDSLGGNPVAGGLLVVFLACMAVGFPMLAAAAWRAGLSRPAALWFGLMPFVAFFVDDGHWANLVTHLLLAASFGAFAAQLWRRQPALPSRLVGTGVLVGCLVAAPALEVLEQLVSPLSGGSTSADLAAIAAHQSAFVVALLVGTVATLLYVPAFLGLGGVAVSRSPRLARTGTVVAALSMVGFLGVRVAQAVELQSVRDGVPRAAAAGLVDGLAGNPVGGVLLVLFLAGSVVGLAVLAAALWRAGLPRAAVLVVGVFPVLDLLLPGRVGTIVTHALLLGAFTVIAVHLSRPDGAVRRSARQDALAA